MKENTIDLSWKSIIKIFFVLLFFYFVFLIKDILILLLFAFLLSFLMEKPIIFLEKRGFSRFVSAFLVYSFFAIFFFSFIYFLLPLFFNELKNFFFLIPDYIKEIDDFLKFLNLHSFDLFSFLFEEWFKKDWTKILDFLRSFFSGILSFFLFCFLSFFISLERNIEERFLKEILPKKYEEKMLLIWERVKENTSQWFGAKILGSLFVAFLTLLLCLVFGLNYSLSFAFGAFILNFLPVIGPIILGFLLFLVSFSESLLKGILVVLGFWLIQLIEGNLILPVLLKRFMKIPYLIIFLSFIIGGKIFGFLGAFFSIPLFVLIFEFWSEFFKEEKESHF